MSRLITLLSLSAMLCIGCAAAPHDAVSPQRLYPIYRIGRLVDGADPVNYVYVTTVEGHHYYVGYSQGYKFLGPEVPADAWKNISRRMNVETQDNNIPLGE